MIRLLEGVRVVESAMLFTGDHLGTLLGDLGADIVKIERPPVGDYIEIFWARFSRDTARRMSK